MQVALKAAFFAMLVAGSGAWAQTAQETLDSEGLAGFTNFEIALGREIQRAGVPDECLGQMPMSAVSEIAALAATEGDTDEIRNRIKVKIEDVCGNLD